MVKNPNIILTLILTLALPNPGTEHPRQEDAVTVCDLHEGKRFALPQP